MVHFVGAGPGAVDLITVRGRKYIEEADVIIYAGSLVNPDLLSFAKKECQIHNSAYMTLEEVIEVICQAEAEGRDLVRLHTGEPSLYGAVREQMDILDKKGIAYDSCPGVSAAFAVASSLNIEYTLPEVSQTLIITRMAGKTDVPSKEAIAGLASHRASMAIYLSTGLLKELTEELIKGGYSEDTPAALVYKASWPEEKKFVCKLSELEKTAKENNITKTALVVVGDVITHNSYDLSRLYAADFSTEFREAKSE